MRAIHALLILLSVALYGFALAVPAYKTYTGWDCLVWGSGEDLAWYANPLLLIAWILLAIRQKIAAILAAGAFAVAISLLGLASKPEDLAALQVGYWLWISSISVALVTGVFLAVEDFLGDVRRTEAGQLGAD